MTRSTSQDGQETHIMIHGIMQSLEHPAEPAIGGDPSEIPTKDDMRWLARMSQLSEDSLKSLEEGAKSLMTACSFFITVYAFIFSEAKDKSEMVTDYPLLFAAPLGFFALAMLSALFVLIPLRYETNEYSVTKARDTWTKIAEDKYRTLLIAVVFTAVGFLALFIALVCYVGK